MKRAWLLTLAVAVSLSGCGPGKPPGGPALDPPPPLDDEPAGVVAPSSPAVEEAMGAIEKGDYARARDILEKERARAPKDAQAAYYLAVALEGLGESASAITAYREALRLDPKLASASINLSAALLDAGDAAGARDVLAAALAFDPRHPGLLMNHAVVLETLGDVPQALAAYERAVGALPKQAELRISYARLLVTDGQKERARAELSKVESDDPAVLSAVGDLLGKLGDYSGCVAALDRAVQTKPLADAIVRRGVCRHHLGDEPGAEADFRKAIAAEETHAAAHFYLGQSLRRDPKRRAEARQAFERAVALAGEQGVGPAARKALGELGAPPRR